MMSERTYLQDWLMTVNGSIACQSVKARLNAMAIREGLTESDVDHITNLTLDAMSTAYDAGYAGGLNRATEILINKEPTE